MSGRGANGRRTVKRASDKRFSVVVAIAAALMVIGSSATQSAPKNFRPRDPSLHWTLRVISDCPQEICRALTQGALSQESDHPDMCRVKGSLTSLPGVSWPTWMTVDPKPYASSIKASVLGELFSRTEGLKGLGKQFPAMSVPELREKFWHLYSDQIMAFFKSGRALVQVTAFDITGDGRSEKLLRITMFDIKEGPETQITPLTCGPGGPLQFHIFAAPPTNWPADKPNYLADALALSGAISEPLRSNGRSYLLTMTQYGIDLEEIHALGPRSNPAVAVTGSWSGSYRNDAARYHLSSGPNSH